MASTEQERPCAPTALPRALVDAATLRDLPVKYHFGTHLHHSVEIVLCRKGSFVITAQNTRLQVNPGEYLAVFPNVLHTADVVSEDDCQVLQINFHCGSVPTRGTGAEEDTFLLELALEKRRMMSGVVTPQLNACAEGIKDEMESDGVGKEHMLSCYIRQLVILMSRDLNLNSDVPPAQNRHLIRATMFVGEHYNEKITVAQVAAEVGVSPRYLTRLFQEQLGIGVAAYITNVRVSRSIDFMLMNPGYPHSQLALDMGFSSQQHFSRVFKEKMGVHPGQYFGLLLLADE